MKIKDQPLIQVRVDRELKDAAFGVYNAIGMDLPTAIRMFLTRSVAVGGLPFEGRIVENLHPYRRVDGVWTNRSLDEVAAEKQRFNSGNISSRRAALIAAMNATIANNAKTLDHDWTMSEIDAEIASVRKERR